MMGPFTLRYVKSAPFKLRLHDMCVARFPTYDEAEAYRESTCPQPDLLEVVERP